MLRLLFAFSLCVAFVAAFPQQQQRRVVVKKVPKQQEEEPPTPFEYSFAAGRAPGSKPDRFVHSEGDEKGVVRGSYAYLDPNYNWQQVHYVADPETGFHVLPGSSDPHAGVRAEDEVPLPLPQDLPNVAAAKEAHKQLFQKIVAEQGVAVNQESAAVSAKRAEHAAEFERIAAEHARIAEEHARRAAEEEEARRRQEAHQA